ncbi:DUF885 domain-containing protein [Clostridium sp. LP20]|uniref:DUF885 domain-containing protein n=1 Tax=Clostridium sp. LP20 TaxID=3418665 RepID=UPI003EE5F5B8
MRKLNKIIIAILILLFSFSIVGCIGKEGAANFDSFINGLPKEFIENNSLDLEFLFRDPSQYGFDEEILKLPVNDKKLHEEGIKSTNEVIDKLKKFDYKKLSKEQQLTYDVLLDSLNRNLLLKDYYYINNNELGSSLGFQAQLPILLQEFKFDKKIDIDSYLNILETSEDTFKKYANNEKERQSQRVGMSQTIINKVIEQCDNFTKDDSTFLIDAFNSKINNVEFLKDEEKKYYKEKNLELTKVNFKNAYKTLANELKAIDAKEDNVGLWGKSDGKSYYEALMQYNTGIDDSIKEVEKYLNNKVREYGKEINKLITENPELMNRFIEANIQYTDLNNEIEVLNYLGNKINEDFPALESLNFNVKEVDQSMKDNFSPAAYISSRIDTPISENETIFINGKFSQDIFTMLAHEGYPGHMYQNVYFKSLNKPTIRYILNYSGYSEGWANYIEGIAIKYATGDKDLLKLYYLNTKIIEIKIALLDIGVNYSGWDKEKFIENIQSFFGELEDNAIEEQYNQIIENPTNSLKYYLCSEKFKALHDDAKKKLGDKFIDKEFHRVILQTGPSSFEILKNRVDEYIDETI